jgi:DNA-binding NtrC family response regulator
MVTVACFSWHPTASEATALAAANYSLTPTTPGTLDSASNADILIVSAAELAEHRAPLEQLLYRTKRPPALLVISRQATNEAVIESPLPFQLLVEPVTSAQLLATLARLAAIQKRYTALGHDVSISSFAGLVSASDKMRAIFESIERVAQFSTTVLIQGESGTGKELVARAIHSCSSRKMQPFIAINCGAIPENLLESELFGHRKGAFTDATRDKKGPI